MKRYQSIVTYETSLMVDLIGYDRNVYCTDGIFALNCQRIWRFYHSNVFKIFTLGVSTLLTYQHIMLL